MTTQDPELSAALGWPGGISDPVLDRTQLLRMVAALRLASQQALEALKLSTPQPRPTDDDYSELGWEEHNAAITALKAALAQEQAESVESRPLTKDWCLRMAQIEMDADAEFEIGPALAQQAESVEPVGEVLHDWSTEKECIDGTWACLNDLGKNLPVGTKLYATPPQRTMVPLTEEEIDALPWFGSPRQFARTVEKAVWEKNHGQV